MPSSYGNEQLSYAGVRHRETDAVVVPPIPASAVDMGRWAMEVCNNVQAASGRTETTALRSWLGECRAEVADPDHVFDTRRTPYELVSLESKLNVSLRAALRAAKDQSLMERIVRE